MTSTFHKGMTRAIVSIVIAAMMLSPVAALAEVPETSKEVSTGSEFTDSAIVSSDSDVSFRIECGLPQDVDDLSSCRYAITDEVPSWMEPDKDTVSLSLVTPGGTAYDLTPAFEIFVNGTTLRAQCDTLREELPAALIDGSKVVLDYSGHIGKLEELPSDSSYGAHLTMTPENGTAKTEASADDLVDLEVVCLDLHVKAPGGATPKGEQIKLLSDGYEMVMTTDDKGVARFVGISTGPYNIEHDGTQLDATIAFGLSDGALDLATAGDALSDPYVEDGGHVCGVNLSLSPSASAKEDPFTKRSAVKRILAILAILSCLMYALTQLRLLMKRN